MSSNQEPKQFRKRAKRAQKLATQLANIEDRAKVYECGAGTSTGLTSIDGKILVDMGKISPAEIRIEIDHWNDEGSRLVISPDHNFEEERYTTSVDKITDLESMLSEKGLI